MNIEELTAAWDGRGWSYTIGRELTEVGWIYVATLSITDKIGVSAQSTESLTKAAAFCNCAANAIGGMRP